LREKGDGNQIVNVTYIRESAKSYKAYLT
jgi:hypothetical protein